MDSIYILAFKVVSLAAVPFWILMICAPNWPFTRRFMTSLVPMLIMALPYAILELPLYLPHLPHFLNPQFEYIQSILGQTKTVTLAWSHFIATDLFAGRWIYLDSRQRGTSPLVMAPIIFLCAMFCPAGITVYLLYRGWQTRSGKVAPSVETAV